jgi:hypothetical protein
MSLKTISLLPLSSFANYYFECIEDDWDSSVLGEVTCFFPDAGASPTHQASQRRSGGQLDKPAQILKLPWKLLRKS